MAAELLRTKRRLVRLAAVDNYCKRCGSIAEDFTVPNRLYRKVVRDGSERCLACFTTSAKSKGILLRWRLSLVRRVKRRRK